MGARGIGMLAAVVASLSWTAPAGVAGASRSSSTAVLASASTSAPVAAVGGVTPLSGGDGWLVWSAPSSSGWVLMGLHDGVAATLPATPRPAPFDASVGTDAQGAPVVVFSRCARTPTMVLPDGEGQAGGTLLQPETGSDCRIRMLALPGGRETAVPIPAPRGASDTTPSIWHGQVTFARHAPSHGDVWQIMSWSPSAQRRLATLPHGRIPSCPDDPHGCTGTEHGQVEALARDGRLVTFVWAVEGEGVIGEGAWEVRVDSANGSHRALAEGGFGHEACTSENEGLEYIWPEPPIAAGSRALFPDLYGYDCFQGYASVLGSHGVVAGDASLGKLSTVALAVADDGGHLYGLVPQQLFGAGDIPGCSSSAPCTIEPLSMPSMRRERRPPFVPFP